MKVTLQRVLKANVEVKKNNIGSIDKGILILIGMAPTDNKKTIEQMGNKILNLRIFNDSQKKMNYSVLDIKGEILIVSQFTLYGDCKKGNRPSFIKSALPKHANKIYNEFVNYIKKKCDLKIETGEFGANMKVSLINNGPVTFNLEIE